MSLDFSPTQDEVQSLAKRFAFAHDIIPVENIHASALVDRRNLRASLSRNEAWVSATGAAPTLADLDGDGLYNDLLLADPRTNSLLVLPVPKTGERFRAFKLEPRNVPFNSRTMSPTGSLVGDFNEDGHSDILVHYWGRTPILFLRRAALAGLSAVSPSDFDDVELIASETGRPADWYTHAAAQADIDGDGHLDLLLGNFFPEGARIMDTSYVGDDDVMHAGKSNANNGGGAKLLLWTPPESRPSPACLFHDRSDVLEKLCGKGWVLAMGAADLDPDNNEWPGLPEIYIANDFGPDRLLHNRSSLGHPSFVLCEGHRGFTTPKSYVMGRDSCKGMGLDFADVNGDGLFDMHVSQIAEDFALHEGHFCYLSTGATSEFATGGAPYAQESGNLGLLRGGWGWDARFVDFDNDGVQELYQATGFIKGTINRWPELHALGTTNDLLVSHQECWPLFKTPSADISGHNVNPLYVRSERGRFINIASELGLDHFWNSRGLAVADIDGDGWQDLVIANQWEPSVVLWNECKRTAPQNEFLALHLVMPTADASGAQGIRISPGHPGAGTAARPAVGATARIDLPSGKCLIAQVDGGSGHSGKRSPPVHFGLGSDPPKSVEVLIRWRDGSGQLQSESLVFESPGWYTVQLGRSES
ncbi:MAG TPA: ASPIC/UnbV domain-containing protein [Pirellulaceae bacterium]|nr:ASPIC/UnbV domain-containing protein [Pirellulaceae bacterium]